MALYEQCVNDDVHTQIWKKYTADCLGAILNGLQGADSRNGVPIYSELFRRKPKPKTAKEIKEGVLRRLTQ